MKEHERNEKIRAARALWSPKLPELKEQCPSCPFREGNHEEFGEIAAKLAVAAGEERGTGLMVFARQLRARNQIKAETITGGDFICHCTAYNDDMTMKDSSEHRQCPGASKFYRESTPDDEHQLSIDWFGEEEES